MTFGKYLRQVRLFVNPLTLQRDRSQMPRVTVISPVRRHFNIVRDGSLARIARLFTRFLRAPQVGLQRAPHAERPKS
jgi:hypothetical protein